MAKKISNVGKKSEGFATPAAKAAPIVAKVVPTPAATSGVASTTPVRNSAIPPKIAAPAGRKSIPITHDAIAKRAYEIACSGRGGSELDNWLQAEHELRNSSI